MSAVYIPCYIHALQSKTHLAAHKLERNGIPKQNFQLRKVVLVIEYEHEVWLYWVKMAGEKFLE